MGKQKHDLGVRKRRLAELLHPQSEDGPRKKKRKEWRPPPLPENYYGPPQHVRDAAHAARQAGMPEYAQRIIEGREDVRAPAVPSTPPPKRNRTREQLRNRERT